MTLKLLTVLLALFLSACATTSGSGASLVSALDALERNVKRDLAPRKLPNGREYCGELARDEEQQDECIGDLEDGFFKSNRDKERGAWTLTQGLKRLRLAITPCRFFDLSCRRQAKALDLSEIYPGPQD